jgi:hypothetical protein
VIKMADLRRPSRKGDSIGGVLVGCMHDVYDAHILIQLLTEGRFWLVTSIAEH